MTKREKLESAMRKAENRAIAVARRRDFYSAFARTHKEFLADIVAWYKRHMPLPDYPVFKLPIYYEDKRDKEIAAVAASLLPFGANYDELHTLIGNHPWQWFIERNFVLLGLGTEQDKRTSGCPNWRISSLMNNFLKVVKKYDAESIGEAVFKDAWSRGLTIENTLMRCYKDEGADAGRCDARLLMLAMSGHDMLGQGVWDIKDPLHCPLPEKIEGYLRMWIPDPRSYGTLDDCVDLFGLNAGDFLLSYFGYFALGAMMPRDFRNYANRHAKWYSEGLVKERNIWRRFMPKIPD